MEPGDRSRNGEQNRIDWTHRFQAVAQAQGRYLWILLVVGIFYLALDRQLNSQNTHQLVHLPIAGISVDPALVWATGSAVTAFVLLARISHQDSFGPIWDSSESVFRGGELPGAPPR
jgi:uncharacterized membrane protein (DUF485 family)